MSYSGRRGMVLNTLERILSSDMNRLQSFAAFGQAEMWRAMINSSAGSDDVDAGGTFTEFNATANPMQSEIFGGLLVQPIAGSMNCSVTDGVMMCLDPDVTADPDDSPYKMIRDPGVLATAPLTITGNVSGSIRIDVIECARVAAPGYTIIETSSRDIYNPVTGLFTATSIPKVTEGRLQYRVRAGTAGAGFPGTAAGWTPLAVVSVPSGAASVNDMTFWDVRPLLNDRAFNLSNLSSTKPSGLDMQIGCANYAATTDITLQGSISIVANGRRLGGKLRRGTPGSDTTVGLVVGSTITDNLEPGFGGFVANGIWYFYLLTPFGLPRWARYTDGPVNRVPRSPRGIPVISGTAPNADGTIPAGIGLPASTGLGAVTTTSGVCVFASCGKTAGQPGVLIAQGRRVKFQTPLDLGAVASSSNVKATWIAQAGAKYPTHARELFFVPTTVVNSTGSFDYDNSIFAYNDAAGTMQTHFATLSRFTGASTIDFLIANDWVPTPPVYPSLNAVDFLLEHHFNLTGSGTFTSALGYLYGFGF